MSREFVTMTLLLYASFTSHRMLTSHIQISFIVTLQTTYV